MTKILVVTIIIRLTIIAIIGHTFIANIIIHVVAVLATNRQISSITIVPICCHHSLIVIRINFRKSLSIIVAVFFYLCGHSS